MTLGRQPVVFSSDSALAGVVRAHSAEKHVLGKACGSPSGPSPAGRPGTALRSVREAGCTRPGKDAVRKPSGESFPDGGQRDPMPGTGHLRDGQDLSRHPWAACPSARLSAGPERPPRFHADGAPQSWDAGRGRASVPLLLGFLAGYPVSVSWEGIPEILCREPIRLPRGARSVSCGGAAALERGPPGQLAAVLVVTRLPARPVLSERQLRGPGRGHFRGHPRALHVF